MVAFPPLATAALASQRFNLTANYRRGQVDPRLVFPEVCPAGVATYDVQPVVVEVKKPILISQYIPSNTVLDLGGGHTLNVDNAPTTISTVITETYYETTQVTR